MFLGNILSLQSLLFIFVAFSVVGIILAVYLNFKVHYK
jgi:type II secretory pathway component PulF